MRRSARMLAWAFAGLLGGCAATGPRVPAPDGPISLDGRCEQTEEDGFRERARLLVVANEVKALSWQLWAARTGSCQFELDDFRQTRTVGSIELAERNGSSCRLLVWQVPARVTLAHAGCERRCTAGIYEEAWPVMFDPGTGGCATR